MHSLGYLWEIGLHDVTMIRRPYIPGLLDSQPQPALALEPWQPIDIHSIISERPRCRGRRMADVATESHNGDFHENRSRACPTDSWINRHRRPALLEKLLEKLTTSRYWREQDSGARAGSHFFLNGT